MIKYPKKIRLKDESTVSLRKLVKNDEKKLIDFFKNLPSSDRHLLKEDVKDRRVIQRWIKKLDYNSVLPIVALYEGKIVADATLHMTGYGWLSHVGEMRCVIDPDFQGKGLGTILIRELYAHAQEKKLKMLMVQMLQEQKTAIKVFENLGFVHAATLHGLARDIKGRDHNLIIMVNNLEYLWDKMEDLIWGHDIVRRE